MLGAPCTPVLVEAGLGEGLTLGEGEGEAVGEGEADCAKATETLAPTVTDKAIKKPITAVFIISPFNGKVPFTIERKCKKMQ